ncbi:MAG: TolC family protein [Candidatus Hydrogenedentota bacterium]
MIRFILVVFLPILFVSYPLQSIDNNDTLTLSKAIEFALENNTVIKEAINAREKAWYEYKSANASRFPELLASYSYTKLKDAPVAVFSGMEFTVGGEESYTYNVTIKQPLFTGYALKTRVKVAELGINIKDIEKKMAVLDVIKNVKIAYYNILLAQKYLNIAHEEVTQLEAHLSDARSLYNEGIIAYNDLLKSEVALSYASQNQRKSESNLKMAVSYLNILLHQDIDKELIVEDILKLTPAKYELVSLINKAIKNRPEIKIIESYIKQSELSAKLVKSSFYPQIFLFGTYKQTGDNFKATNYDFGRFYDSIIGVEAKWILFDWGKRKAEIDKCQYDKLALQEKVNSITDNIKLEVKDAYLNLSVAEDNISIAKKSLTQAEENFRITNLQYQQQATTSTEVIDARTFLTRAEMNYYNALYGYLISQAELERATASEF